MSFALKIAGFLCDVYGAAGLLVCNCSELKDIDKGEL